MMTLTVHEAVSQPCAGCASMLRIVRDMGIRYLALCFGTMPLPDSSPQTATSGSAPPKSVEPNAEPVRSSHWRTDLLRIAAVLGLLAALIAFGYFMQGPIKRLGPAERCWENREIDGKLYRFNPCTGQFKLLGDVIPGAVIPGSE